MALLVICASSAAAQSRPDIAWPRSTPAAPHVASGDAPTQAQAQATPRVDLQLRPDSAGIDAIAVNRLAGPVEVTLLADGPAYGATPALPLRTTVPAGASVVLARLPVGGSGVRLRLPAVPGLPSARPRDVAYLYPFREAPLRIAQGYGGGFSHTDAENLHAVDFAVQPGTPVLAARDGQVMQVESSARSRLDPRQAFDPADDRVRGNFIRILHDDGTMALYAHLQHGGVVVAPGARVRRGTVIGFSGNTGLSSGPHLHFVVQVNRGMRLESIPFRMTGPDGPLRFGQVHAEAAPAAP